MTIFMPTVTTLLGTDCNSTQQDLGPFNRLQIPVWVFDIENRTMWWANTTALEWWDGKDRTHLQSRDFASDMSDINKERLSRYLEQFGRNQAIQEQWTFYLMSQPVTVDCTCSGLHIDGGRIAMLVEGVPIEQWTIQRDFLRGVGALRYTSAMINLFDLHGGPLFQNLAADRAFGPTIENTRHFLERVCDRYEAEMAWVSVSAGRVIRGEYRFQTRQGEQWREIACRLTKDPATGEMSMLVYQQIMTEKH